MTLTKIANALILMSKQMVSFQSALNELVEKNNKNIMENNKAKNIISQLSEMTPEQFNTNIKEMGDLQSQALMLDVQFAHAVSFGMNAESMANIKKLLNKTQTHYMRDCLEQHQKIEDLISSLELRKVSIEDGLDDALTEVIDKAVERVQNLINNGKEIINYNTATGIKDVKEQNRIEIDKIKAVVREAINSMKPVEGTAGNTKQALTNFNLACAKIGA